MLARGAVVTEESRCAARELGRFQLAEGRRPSRSLRDFITNRCGLVASELSLRVLQGPAPDKDLATHWRDQLQTMADQTPSGLEAGMWLGFADGRSNTVMLVSGTIE